MELSSILNPDSDLDIFCLHYVAFSLIQNALDRFKMSWNNHSIRTEGHKSPYQLYVSGLAGLRNHGSHFTELKQVYLQQLHVPIYQQLFFFTFFLFHQDLDGGTLGGNTRDLDDNSVFKVEAVEVPEFLCPLTEMEQMQLRQRFNVDLVTITNLPDCFIRVRAFVIQLVDATR